MHSICITARPRNQYVNNPTSFYSISLHAGCVSHERGRGTPAHIFTFLSPCFCSSSVRSHHQGARCLTRTVHLLQQDKSKRRMNGERVSVSAPFGEFISIQRHITLFSTEAEAGGVRNPRRRTVVCLNLPTRVSRIRIALVCLVKEYPWHVLFIVLAELWPSSRWREVTMKRVNYLSHIRTRHEPLGLKALDSAFPSSPSAAINLLTGVKLYASPLF